MALPTLLTENFAGKAISLPALPDFPVRPPARGVFFWRHRKLGRDETCAVRGMPLTLRDRGARGAARRHPTTSEGTPMRLRILRHLGLLAATALVLACHGKGDASLPGGGTPETSLRRSIDLLKAGDFQALWRQSLPPADYATLRADWSRRQRQAPAFGAAEQARFTEAMQQLTGQDAAKHLFAAWQPRLIRAEQQYGDQLPVLVSVGGALAKARVMQDPDLGSARKTQLDSMIDTLVPWAQQAPWFDQARAKQAIGVAVATARKLDLNSPGPWRTMDFNGAMTRYATGYAGLKQMLAIYGLSVDQTLDSIRLTPVSRSNGRAVVRIDYSLLGKPLSTESTLIEQGGRWYSEDLLDQVRASHRRLIQSANQPPAGSASTPPAAAATPSRGAAGKA